MPAETPAPPTKDDPQYYVGRIFEEVFGNLYRHDKREFVFDQRLKEGVEPETLNYSEELDFSEEDKQIAAIQAALAREHEHADQLMVIYSIFSTARFSSNAFIYVNIFV